MAENKIYELWHVERFNKKQMKNIVIVKKITLKLLFVVKNFFDVTVNVHKPKIPIEKFFLHNFNF